MKVMSKREAARAEKYYRLLKKTMALNLAGELLLEKVFLLAGECSQAERELEKFMKVKR